MTHSERVRQTIGMGIDCLVHGIIERFAQEVVPRVRLNANELSPMGLLKYWAILQLVQPFGCLGNSP